MNGTEAIDFERYRKARQKSVTVAELEAEKEQSYLEGRKVGYAKGAKKWYKKGVKRGIIIGATIAILTSGVVAFNHVDFKDYSNESYTYGIEAVRGGKNPTLDHQHYWYDYFDIADDYDPQTMDFDAFVFGTYKALGWDEESKYSCMKKLFPYFYKLEFTEFETFVDYCNAKGLCYEKNGSLVVDIEKYKEAAKEYIASLNEIEEYQEVVNSFKGGLS